MEPLLDYIFKKKKTSNFNKIIKYKVSKVYDTFWNKYKHIFT